MFVGRCLVGVERHMDHVVYLDAKANELDRLLDGSKAMIIRGATGRKLPYGRVHRRKLREVFWCCLGFPEPYYVEPFFKADIVVLYRIGSCSAQYDNRSIDQDRIFFHCQPFIWALREAYIKILSRHRPKEHAVLLFEVPVHPPHGSPYLFHRCLPCHLQRDRILHIVLVDLGLI